MDHFLTTPSNNVQAANFSAHSNRALQHQPEMDASHRKSA
jgi:hypothetical protein